MSNILPSFIKIICPNCGHKFQERLTRLKMNKNRATCPKCSAGFDLTKVVNGLKSFEKNVATIERQFSKKFGKK